LSIINSTHYYELLFATLYARDFNVFVNIKTKLWRKKFLRGLLVRSIFLHRGNISPGQGEHIVKGKLVSGTFALDALAVYSEEENMA